MKPDTQEYIEELESALIDAISPDTTWRELYYNTGCSKKERCIEILDLYHKVKTNYEKGRGYENTVSYNQKTVV